MLAGLLIGGLVGILGVAAGIVATLYGLGFFEHLGGKKKSSIAPMRKQALIEKILHLNSPQLPYQIKTAENSDLVLEWNIVDARWYGIYSKEKLKKTYRAFMLADENRHSFRYYEELGTVEWIAGAPKISYREQFFKGRILFQKSWGIQYGIKEDGTLGKVYDYKFDISMVRNSIKKLVEDNGWEFVPVIRKKNAIYR
jgi:hypothetical protein